MSTPTGENQRHRGVVLSSPKEETTNWNQYEFSMKWIMKHKHLWYLLDDVPIKLENGLPVSREIQERDSDSFCALLMESIHPENIFLIEECLTPKEMWTSLKNRHQQMTAGSRFLLLRTLMSMSVTNEDDISSHIIEIGSLGTRLRKLCVNGMISIKDVQTASLIASLPDSFSSVTSPFEQRENAEFEEVCIAVKGHIITRKNQQQKTSAATTSTANVVKADNPESKLESSKYKSKGKKKSRQDSTAPTAGPCTHCNGRYHDVSTCLQKKNDDLNTKLDTLIKQMLSGKANRARESE